MSRFVPFCPVLSRFVPCPGLPGAKTKKSAMVTMVALLFGNKSVMVRPMVGLWSLWSGGEAFIQFWPICQILGNFAQFVQFVQFVRVHGLPRAKIPKSAMVTMVTSCFSTKVLWSCLWSRLWSLWSLRFSQKPPDLTGLTIALLLPNKRATIVTIALFWVLAPRSPGHGTKRDKTGHLVKIGQKP